MDTCSWKSGSHLILIVSSATKLQSNHEISLSAELKGPDECVTCHVMCDEIGMSQLLLIDLG